MKKIALIAIIFVALLALSIGVLQTKKNQLFLLNWGEYISEDVVERFEDMYDCVVVEETVTSSEIMYQKITAGTTNYDVAVPGDYCVLKLYEEGYLQKIDVNNPEYEYLNNYETMFSDSLKSIMDSEMNVDGENIKEYFMPYFWGAYSMIYSTINPEVESVVKNSGFKALYDRSLYNSSVRIGMYNTPRWVVSSYLMSNNYNPNITTYDLDQNEQIITSGRLSEQIKTDISSTLKNIKFDAYGDDSLKRDVAGGRLDLCYTQLGDFFDVLYFAYEESDTPSIDFNVCVPDTTAAFFDSLVIPTTVVHEDLANKFINFMMNPENAYENAQAIGYCPTLKAVCESYRTAALNGEYYFESENEEYSLTMEDFLTRYPMYLDPLCGSTNVCLLEPKSSEYLTDCSLVCNKIA